MIAAAATDAGDSSVRVWCFDPDKRRGGAHLGAVMSSLAIALALVILFELYPDWVRRWFQDTLASYMDPWMILIAAVRRVRISLGFGVAVPVAVPVAAVQSTTAQPSSTSVQLTTVALATLSTFVPIHAPDVVYL